MRRAAKSALISAVFVTMVPVMLIYVVLRLARTEPFAAFSQWFALYPGKLGSYTRAIYLALTTAGSSVDTRIGFGTVFSQRETTIEPGVYIGPQCNIGACRVGEKTLIASGVHLLSGKQQHGVARLDVPIQEQPGEYQQITIGRDCWIGNAAIVMADVGDQAIVGAGSVVTKPLPARSIAVGNPARVVGMRGESNQPTMVSPPEEIQG